MIVILSSTIETVISISYKMTDTQLSTHNTDVDTATQNLPIN